MHTHFGEKSALSHVLEKRSEGIKEIHGTELPGHLAACADALRESALFLLIIWIFSPSISILAILSAGWFFWKMSRSSFLGWARLERLHRLIEQEKYEIEHHRPQEREELEALYREKGFSGKLLDEVVDVLMADQDRLLKVMLEEELGLALESYEHPLKQAVGAGCGVIIATVICLTSSFLFPSYGMILSSLTVVGGGAFMTALYEGNRIISAVIWNVSMASVTFGIVSFLKMMI